MHPNAPFVGQKQQLKGGVGNKPIVLHPYHSVMSSKWRGGLPRSFTIDGYCTVFRAYVTCNNTTRSVPDQTIGGMNQGPHDLVESLVTIVVTLTRGVRPIASWAVRSCSNPRSTT